MTRVKCVVDSTIPMIRTIGTRVVMTAARNPGYPKKQAQSGATWRISVMASQCVKSVSASFRAGSYLDPKSM